MAFVVIQHLDPTHESLTAEILARKTRMRVREIEDGMKVQPRHVYVLPPNSTVVIRDGILNLMPRRDAHGQNLPIDFFFEALALDQKSTAIGIVLSGTGTDGTRGLESIKAEGGLAIAQDPRTAKFDNMPRSAIASGAVDLVLRPEAIADELDRFAKHPYLSGHSSFVAVDFPVVDDSGLDEDGALNEIFALLRNQSHVDFTHYKHTTLKRRIARRMVVQKKNTLQDYVAFLRSNPQEARALFSDFLINVTEFFRDAEYFGTLKKYVFPKILKNRAAGVPVRIWVTGCATGEEAYSVAISLLEVMGEAAQKSTVQIFATDISEPAIQKARAGIYPESIRKSVSEERLKRFFVRTDGGYKISKFIRDICLFSKHDVTSDPPFAKLDLICCRNLLIYFDTPLQKRVLPIFHYALNPGGFLWLGRSETIGSLSSLFKVVDKTRRLYARGSTPARLHFGNVRKAAPEKHDHALVVPSTEATAAVEFQRDAERALISEYAPPGVLVNGAMEIVLSRGETSPYLKLPHGQASLNLFKMARPDIVADLRMAIQAAKKQNAPVKKENLDLHEGALRSSLIISVIPATAGATARDPHFWVLFEQVSSPPRADQGKSGKGSERTIKGVTRKAIAQRDRRIEELDRALAEARSYQQTLAEDHEATQEEFTSANEELQSANEELQSTNEELETAKEELQSANEELTTINDELQNRNVDLGQLNNDLVNLLGTIDFPIIMVGADGRVRRFTPMAAKLLNMVSGDIGRPIADIRPGFDEPNLKALVTEVMDTIAVIEKEICVRDDRWFRLQVRPYKTTDNRIDGAVISFVDITALRSNLNEAQVALTYAAAVADTLPLPLVVLDEHLKVLSANGEFVRKFKLDPEKHSGGTLSDLLGDPQWGEPRLKSLLSNVIKSEQDLANFEIEYEVARLDRRILLLNARKIMWKDSMPKALLLSLEDITSRRTVERALEISENRFRLVVENAHDAILLVHTDGKIEFANNQAIRWFGYTADELETLSVEDLVPESAKETYFRFRDRYVRDAKPWPLEKGLEFIARRKDGSEFPVEVSLAPITNTFGETKITVIARDVSENRKLSTERNNLFDQEKVARASAEEAKGEAERANEAKNVFLATLSHELRTPLTSILAWAQLLKKGPTDPAKLSKGLTTIEQSAETQGQLINDLLDISRIQSGKLALNLTDVHPSDVVYASIEALRPMADLKGISIEMFDRPNLGTVRGDPARLRQVVWNLLTNSIKFSHKGGKVEVHLDVVPGEDRSCVSIRVVDHGKGIEPEFLPYLFARFSQQDKSSTRAHGGLGIGLALVRDLVESHGGEVKATSPGAGKGAVFTVLLPMMREGEVSSPSEAGSMTEATVTSGGADTGPMPNLSGVKVLLVDDERTTLTVFGEMVNSWGAEATTCGSASEAMEVLVNARPDVIVSDIAMPEEDGYSFMRRVRSLKPEQGGTIPAIALSAFAEHHNIERAFEAGFQVHLAKPVKGVALARAIGRLAALRKR